MGYDYEVEEEVEESEGEGEDLLGDNMLDAYASNPELDAYASNPELDAYASNPELDAYAPAMLVDSGEARELSTRARLAAEREIRERDPREARGGRGRMGMPLIDEDDEYM